ncbi:ankyrin repeat domain-containing protein [bacterium]|nr:ankyrin repeat domain-containing protein [bacterium]
MRGIVRFFIVLSAFIFPQCLISGEESIFELVKKGDLIKIQALLKTNPMNVDAKESIETRNADIPLISAATPLHLAAFQGSASISELLIQAGADVNATAKKGNTPLHLAVWMGNDATVMLLLKNGAAINLRNQIGFSPLELAIFNRREEISIFLLSNGADVCGKESNMGATSLHYTVPWAQTKIAGILLEKGADLNSQDNEGMTPLHWAVKPPLTWVEKVNHQVPIEMAKFLLNQKGIKILKDSKGRTPHDLAIETGRQDLIKLFQGLSP